MSRMKVLSLMQPWAHLFVNGNKKNETRTWQTSYRGELYIHASSKFNFSDLELCKQDKHFKKAIPDPSILITGAIIGKVKLINCLPTTVVKKAITEEEKTFGDYSPGRFAWMAIEPQQIEPIYFSGSLSIWNFYPVGTEVTFELDGKGKSEIIEGVIESHTRSSYTVKSFYGHSYSNISSSKIKEREVSHA